MSKKSEGTTISVSENTVEKQSLENLLKLEKAARVVCIKYEKMATTFEMQNNFLGHNDLEYSELQMNFKKFNEIHEKIINDLEDYLNEYYKQD